MEPGKSFKSGSVASFGYEVPYAESGTGEVIISLPGSAGLEHSTAKDMLAQHYRIVELDPPGWGQTPAVAAEMQQRQLAHVLADAIEAMGIASYHLIGTSMGAINAFWLARHFPDRVKSLTLEGPMLFHRPEDLVNPDESFILALRAGAPPPDVSNYPAPPAHPNKPWATPELFREQMRLRFKMMAKTDYPADNSRLVDFARTSSIPTQMLLGSCDEILKPSFADRFQSTVPNATVTIVEGATHDIQNSAPEQFVAAIKRIVG